MSSVQRWGGEPTNCQQCGLKVYAAEEVMANGFKWHRLCLKCTNCNKLLSPGSVCNHEESVYCRPCHTRLYGPRGYGYAGGGAGLPTEPISSENVPPPLQQSAVVNSQSSAPHSAPNLKKSSISFAAPSTKPFATASKFTFGGAPKCKRCNQSVYAAERVLGGGHSYHKRCFRCYSCSRTLDSVTLCERDEELFCRSCYGKQFGPKGFGFGITSMQTETTN